MRATFLLTIFLYSYACCAQVLKGIHSKGPAQETIFQVRKEADAAFALNIQSIVRDTCGSFSSENTYVVTGKIIKKYFDKTGKFKDVKISYLTTDTEPYNKDPYHIVFLNEARSEVTEKCQGIVWISKPGNAFVFTPKTETMVAKKED